MDKKIIIFLIIIACGIFLITAITFLISQQERQALSGIGGEPGAGQSQTSVNSNQETMLSVQAANDTSVISPEAEQEPPVEGPLLN